MVALLLKERLLLGGIRRFHHHMRQEAPSRGNKWCFISSPGYEGNISKKQRFIISQRLPRRKTKSKLIWCSTLISGEKRPWLGLDPGLFCLGEAVIVTKQRANALRVKWASVESRQELGQEEDFHASWANKLNTLLNYAKPVHHYPSSLRRE